MSGFRFESIKKVGEYSVYYDNFQNQMTESNIDIKQKFTTTGTLIYKFF